jgi:hypothetical protein
MPADGELVHSYAGLRRTNSPHLNTVYSPNSTAGPQLLDCDANINFCHVERVEGRGQRISSNIQKENRHVVFIVAK